MHVPQRGDTVVICDKHSAIANKTKDMHAKYYLSTILIIHL